MTVKGCKRIFDVPCRKCDRELSSEAKDEWRRRVEMPQPYGNAIASMWSEKLRRHCRELAGGWGKKLRECREDDRDVILPHDYTPDTQGCLETPKKRGGTLATLDSEFCGNAGLVRLGVAKTKGKYRCVTMQSAYVKRVLRPLHNALYDHLSGFGFIVRGDVTSQDFEAVASQAREFGESVISGDYTSATDRIFLPAVRAIVEELSSDPHLSVEEREVFLASFGDLSYVVSSCSVAEGGPILRGSMMGNLMSFPLLCILNKACFDMATEEVYGRDVRRVGRFNGDDCCFAGNRQLYRKWRLVTSIFGLEVNESKTMISNRWIDLNSQVYDMTRKNMIPKPTLGFLRPHANEPGEILTSILKGIASFSNSTQLWIVNCVMRWEISVKGFSPSNLPPMWIGILQKRKWFRKLAIDGPATTIVKRNIFEKVLKKDVVFCPPGDVSPAKKKEQQRKVAGLEIDRDIPMVLGPPPVDGWEGVMRGLLSDVTSFRVDFWLGKKVCPVEYQVDRVTFKKNFLQKQKKKETSSPLPRTRFLGFREEWAFVWPKVLLEQIQMLCPTALANDRQVRKASWLYYPQLTLRYVYIVERRKLFYPPGANLLPPSPSLGSFPFLDKPKRM